MGLNGTRNDIYVGYLTKTRINASFEVFGLNKPNCHLGLGATVCLFK